MNLHKMGKLEGVLKITEHNGFQIVAYKVLGSIDMLRGYEQLSMKAPSMSPVPTLGCLGHGQECGVRTTVGFLAPVLFPYHHGASLWRVSTGLVG